jgi:hypothetical protein
LLKKKLHISFILLLYLGIITPISAQISVTLPEANIAARSNYTVTLNSGTYSGLVGLIPIIQAKANTANFANTVGGTATVPLNAAFLKIRSIGSLSVLGSATEVTITTAYQVMYTALANLSSGAFVVDYRINSAANTWVAGIYRTPVQFYTGVLSPNRITPNTPNFDITIPAFMTPQATLGTVNLPVNSFSLYRAANGLSVTKTISVSNTVPYILNLQTGSSLFTFNTSLPYNQLPSSAVGQVSGTLTGIGTATTINLSTTSQALTNATGIVVPTNNNQVLNAAFSINGANLKQSFVQAGTYLVPITFTWNKLSTAYPTGTLQTSRAGNLQVTVSDLSEVVANQTNVSLAFSSASNYQQGVSKQMPAHIKISKTTPYNLYVRALTGSFTSGTNQIPLNVLRIGPMVGQTGMNTITLSTTSQQLINTANPVIDRNLNVLYSIPASETSKLLGKPAGSYSTTIVFSFVAL